MRRSLTCWLILVTLLAGACGDDGDADRAAGGPSGDEATPALPDGWQGPGTPIASGLTVAEGTHLVGRAMPDLQRAGGPADAEGDALSRSWVAVLAIDGDPAEAFDAYVRQAEELAIPLEPHGAEGPCAPEGPRPATHCAAYTYGAPETTPTLELDLATTPPGEDPTWSGSIILRWSAPDREGDGPLREAVVNDEALIGAAITDRPVPVAMPAPPEAGDPLARFADAVLPELDLPEGTTALVPSAPGQYWGTWATILRTSRDPLEVIDEVLAGRGPSERRPNREHLVDGEAVVTGSWDQAGGDKLYVVAAPDGAGGWFVLVDVSTDH